MPRKQTKSAREKAFWDWNHGQAGAPEFAPPPYEISEGSGTLFDVPESNLDDGVSFKSKSEIADSNALSITRSNVGPTMIMVVGFVAMLAMLVGSIVYTIENPPADRPYRDSSPVNTDPTSPCFLMTAFECKWN